MNEYLANASPEAIMEHACALAEQAAGSTSPNPMVGAVVLDSSGRIVGQGCHWGPGSDHAEVVALREAGDLALGAKLYVNLEPCSHHGRTPPCVDAILAAGIAEVYVGHGDPNPLVNGRGIARLREANVIVHEGIAQERCRWLNRVFLRFMSTGLPWVTTKVAMTLNGKVTDSGRAITADQARRQVHLLRSRYDCLLTGSGTVLADDPSLNVRLVQGRDPLRVVVDRRLRCLANPELRIWRTGTAPTWLATDATDGPQEHSQRIMLYDGSFPDLWCQLAARNVTSVMVEAGPTLNTSLLAGGYVQELNLFVASRTVPENELAWQEGAPVRGRLVGVEPLGDDFLSVYELREV